MNGVVALFVKQVMAAAARRAHFIAVVMVGIVPAVPGFAQSHTRDNAIVFATTSSSAARAYDPAGTSRDATLPDNLIVPATFRPTIDAMLRGSATFRRQCLRIAQAADLTVRLQHPSGLLPKGIRARARLERDGAGRLAIIEIPALDDTAELIGHEIEHVIEHLDGINLPAHADRRHSTVRFIGSDRLTFETERARFVGLIIAAELREASRERRTERGMRAHASSPRR